MVSGQLLETVVFHSDPSLLQRNLDAGRLLLQGLGSGTAIPTRVRNGSRQEWDGRQWDDVSAADVIAFLQGYSTHRDAHRVVSTVLADFVRIMAEAGELTRWTVALIGSERGAEHHLAEGIPVRMLKRSAAPDSDKFSIGRLMSPRDESVDLDEASWNAALALTRANWKPDPARSKGREEPDVPNGPSMRQVRGFGADGIPPSRDRGLLILYVIDPKMSGWQEDGRLPPALAFGISFPGSNGGPKVEYKVGNVYWEQVYGTPD